MSKRLSNFENLRILAMAMVVTLHYSFKGLMVSPVCDNGLANNIILWLIPAFAMCAVNVYVLISGYFLVESEFKISRLVSLIVQVLEYSIVVSVIMLATGLVDVSAMSLYDFIAIIFPIGTEMYWFISAYVVMYLLSPLLSAGAKAISKRNLGIVITVLLVLITLEKTILPVSLPLDRAGYDFGWFVVLYLIAAYIRLYGIGLLEDNKAFSWIMYVLSALMIWATQVGFGKCYADTGISIFKRYSEISTDYNYVFCLTAALGLFYGFKNLKLNEESRWAEIARKIGPMTLGVYLLHEHPMIRYSWQEWLGVFKERSVAGILSNWIICMVIIYVAGILVEWLRCGIHNCINKRGKYAE